MKSKRLAKLLINPSLKKPIFEYFAQFSPVLPKNIGVKLLESIEIPANAGECSELLASKVDKVQHLMGKGVLD